MPVKQKVLTIQSEPVTSSSTPRTGPLKVVRPHARYLRGGLQGSLTNAESFTALHFHCCVLQLEISDLFQVIDDNTKLTVGLCAATLRLFFTLPS